LLDVVSDDDVASPDVAVPEVSPSLSPPELLFEAELSLLASPPVASELLLLLALPLLDTLASLWPPFPPLAEELASPEFPDCAVVSPSPPEPPESAVALPV
jgi:hypothetical protein